MLTSIAFSLLLVWKYILIGQSLIAALLIFESVINVRLGVRTAYIHTLLWIFRYGKNRIDIKRPAVERYQKPEKTWTRLQAKAEMLEDEPTARPLDVEVEEIEPSEFKLLSVFPLLRSGLRAIVDDEVTKAFDAEELPYWNLLTRTNKGYQYISFRLTILWGLGFFFRHFLLFPIRLMIAIFGILFLLATASVCARLQEGSFKIAFVKYSNIVSFRILARAMTIHIIHHGRQNKAKKDGICVSNHTSPIDVVVLSCDNVYSFVGQQHGGPFGYLQKELQRAFDHIYFERSESKDRGLVTKRMHDHIQDSSKPPILIFPEGACVNNTSILMFKKGSFEVDCPIYPVAIRYNPVFGDAFWGNQPTMQAHIWEIMTSWAIVCDVWYLPVMVKKGSIMKCDRRKYADFKGKTWANLICAAHVLLWVECGLFLQPDEDAAAFANRVRLEIGYAGGLVDIDWDPRFYPDAKKPEDSRWRKHQQKVISERIGGRRSESSQSSATTEPVGKDGDGPRETTKAAH